MTAMLRLLLRPTQTLGPRPLTTRLTSLQSLINAVTWEILRNKSHSGILSRSTVLLQDGLDIRELPWVIRRMDPTEFPFTSATYSASDVKSHASGSTAVGSCANDEAFQQLLLECSTVHQVIRRLEVPGEQVTVHSAAFALQRICQLRERTMDDVDSFIRKAILNELCETVSQGVTQLSNQELVSLVRCFLTSPTYGARFIGELYDEIEKRLADSRFTVSQLCSLVVVLSENIQGDINVTNNVWTHMASRYNEINCDVIGQVYDTMRYITPQFNYVWSLLDKQLLGCWWKLTPSAMSSVCVRVTVSTHRSVSTMSCVTKWIFSNVHTVNDSLMKDIVSMCAHFDYTDHNVINAIERYVNAKVSLMDRTLIAMIVDLCRQRRYISPFLLDSVALDFTSHYNPTSPAIHPDSVPFQARLHPWSETDNYESDMSQCDTVQSGTVLPDTGQPDIDLDLMRADEDTQTKQEEEFEQQSVSRDEQQPLSRDESQRTKVKCCYAAHELLLTLRVYGHLNYLPTNSQQFFVAVEQAISENFTQLSPEAILDLLTSFVYLERFPVNFISRVFTPHFLARVKGIKDAGMRVKACRLLLQLQTAVLLEFPKHRRSSSSSGSRSSSYSSFVNTTTLLDASSLNVSLTWLEGRHFRFHQEMGSVLRQLIGSQCFIDVYVPVNTPHLIDFELSVDSKRQVLPVPGAHDKHKSHKLAVVGLMSEHFCVNSHHLIGEQQTKLRHLSLLGYTVIPVVYEVFMWKCKSAQSKISHLSSLLSQHIHLNTPSPPSHSHPTHSSTTKTTHTQTM